MTGSQKSEDRPGPDLTTDGLVAACPDCGSSNVSLASPGGTSSMDTSSGRRYYCGRCQAKFDDYDERPAQGTRDGGGTWRSKLLKADPEDWP